MLQTIALSSASNSQTPTPCWPDPALILHMCCFATSPVLPMLARPLFTLASDHATSYQIAGRASAWPSVANALLCWRATGALQMGAKPALLRLNLVCHCKRPVRAGKLLRLEFAHALLRLCKCPSHVGTPANKSRPCTASLTCQCCEQLRVRLNNCRPMPVLYWRAPVD